MPPELGSILLVLETLSLLVLSFHFNISAAKRHVSVWKGGTTFLFFRLLGAGRLATSFWMKEMDYVESDAIILAKYQGRAVKLVVLGFTVIGYITVSFVRYP